MISRKAKYALRALIALARAEPGAPVRVADLAQLAHAPQKFLERILLDMRNRGYVVSKRGANGGYMLRMPAREITYGEILRLVDGPLAPLPCLSKTAYRRCADCPSEADCDVRRVFAKVAEDTRATLDSATIAEALGKGAAAPKTRRPRRRA